MDFKKSKTWSNLLIAFSKESEAHTKYLYYASKAKKEGLNIISSIFEETAKNEKEHAKIWFKKMHDDDIPITLENLKDAIKGENYEWNEMYSEFSKIAEEEGYYEISKLFKLVGEVESHHSKRFNDLLNSLTNNQVFNSEEPVLWICTNCGHLHVGKTPPLICPVCKHPQSYFVRENRVYN